MLTQILSCSHERQLKYAESVFSLKTLKHELPTLCDL
jgi:hypothetical protein